MVKKAERKNKLDYKCRVCKTRYNLSELSELGYIDTIGREKCVICPECESQELLK